VREQKKSEPMIQPVHYSRGRIAIINKAVSLRVYTVRGYPGVRHPGQLSQQVVYPQSLPAIQSVLLQQESLIITDTHNYPPWRPHFQEAAAVRSWLGVPLVVGGKLTGLISINQIRPNYFTEEHQALAEALATQAASAVQNAQLFEQVRTGRERLRKLTKQVVSAQEEERQRISRELHDEAGQSLTALKLSLDQIRATLPLELEYSRQSIGEAIELTDITMENIRLLAQDLRPLALDTLGLNATLEGLCHDFAQRTRLPIKYKGVDLPPLPSPVTISLYRYVQEALTNIAKHARATTVQVVLRHNPDMITLSVTDNGKGFQMEANATQLEGIGLIGMYERLELLGGRLEIDSEPGQGTRLVAYIPFQEEQTEE
jgi:signal transduction histidine kinase